MKNIDFPVILFPMLFTLIFCGTGKAGEVPLDPDQLVSDLKAREARFDNAALVYTCTGEFDKRRKFGFIEGHEEYVAPFLYHCHLIVRGNDTTIMRQLDPWTPARVPNPRGSGTVSACPFYKARCISGISTDIAGHDDNKTRDLVFVQKTDDECASFLRARFERELALGFGWAQYVREMESVVPHEEGVLLTCAIQIPSKDIISSGTFLLDASLLVREATIETGLFPVRWEVRQFSSTGVFEKNGFVCARYGRFRSAVYGHREETNKIKQIEKEESHLKCEDIRFDLSDTEYESLVRITASKQGAIVKDRAKNGEYRVEPGTVIAIRRAELPAQETKRAKDE